MPTAGYDAVGPHREMTGFAQSNEGNDGPYSTIRPLEL